MKMATLWERTIQCGALAATPMATLALGSMAMKKRISIAESSSIALGCLWMESFNVC